MKNFKRALLFIVMFAGCAIISLAQTPLVGTDHKIVSSWTPPPTPSTGSHIGYTETITPPPGVTGTNVIPILLASTPVCSSTVTANCMAAGGVGYTWAPNPGPLYCGPWSISLVANYVDGSGNPQTSTAVSTTVTEPCPFVASPVTGLSAAPAP